MAPRTHTTPRWRETCRGSGVFVLGPVDGPHVRYWAVSGGFLVCGFSGPQIDIWVRRVRAAREAGRRALLIEWPKLSRRRAARRAEEAA